jgi:hypothetical protein
MDPNEPVADLSEQMSQLGRSVAALDGSVTELRRQVQGLGGRVTAQGESLGQRITEQGESLGARIAAQGESVGERIASVEQQLAVVKSNYATKADLLEVKNSIIMWLVSAVFLAQVIPLLVKRLGG